MSNIFKKSYTLPIPVGAAMVTVKGVPSARFEHKRKKITAPLTKGGNRVRVTSPFWYGRVAGAVVKLFTDAVASQQRLAELIRKSERKECGIADPFEEHRNRSLIEHLDDWSAALRNAGAGEKHSRSSVQCVKQIARGCKYESLADISASRTQQYLADLRKDRPALAPLDPAKESYTKAELAAVLGVRLTAIPSLIKRHRLNAEGDGKARRYPKATAESLREKRGRGISIKTSNLYLSAFKAFCAWLVKDRRMSENPLEHLQGGNVKLDRRHDRRILDESELRTLIEVAKKSDTTYRGLEGHDRAILYLTACATGFRAGELAALSPNCFDTDELTLTLSGSYTKNQKTAVQPVPLDVAESLRHYLEGKPVDQPIWPGTWHERAADMLRVDLDAASIPYVLQGGDGPLYADFHCLRHSFVALLDRSGATLKEAMQLARHSDPKLTMAVYGKARLHDLAGAIDRLPSLSVSASTETENEAMRATGTEGLLPRLPFPCRASEEACENMAKGEERSSDIRGEMEMPQTVTLMADGDACETLTKDEKSSPRLSQLDSCFVERGTLQFKRLRRSPVIAMFPWNAFSDTKPEPKPAPKERRDPLKLARYYQSLLDSGKFENRAALARYLGVSRARVTQVLRRLGTQSMEGRQRV